MTGCRGDRLNQGALLSDGPDGADISERLDRPLRLLALRIDSRLQAEQASPSPELRRLRLLTTKAIHSLREVATARDLAEVGTYGLEVALTRMAAAALAQDRCSVEVRVHGCAESIPRHVLALLTWSVRSVLAEVLPGARSSVVLVRVGVEAQWATVEIVHDGLGLVHRSAKAEYALTTIARGLRAAGGRCEIREPFPTGMELRLRIPFLDRRTSRPRSARGRPDLGRR